MRKPCFTTSEYLWLGLLTTAAVGTGLSFARLLDEGYVYLSLAPLVLCVATTFIGGIGWWVLLCQVFERTTPVEDSFAVFVPPTGPRITSVTYRQLHTFGNYQNESVEATAEVRAGETPEKVLEGLKEWVAARLNVRELRDAKLSEIEGLDNEIANLRRNVEKAREQFAKAKTFLAENKIGLYDEPPF